MSDSIEISVKQHYEALVKTLDEIHKEDREKLMMSWKAAQMACPHKNTDWEPDPSGNNDSTHWCKDCGKTGRTIYELQKKRGQR